MIPALILARAGSKGIPGKNKCRIGGIPLVARTAIEAVASKFNPVYVWSDDEEIRRLSETMDIQAPSRPVDTSGDDTTSEESVASFLRQVDPQGDYKAIALLQCTTPFLMRKHLDAVYDKWMLKKHDSIITATDVSHKFFGYPNTMLYVSKDAEFIPMRPYRKLRQQESMKLYMENGGCYLATRELWLSGRRIGETCGVVLMPWWDSIEIDEPLDLENARRINGHSIS